MTLKDYRPRLSVEVPHETAERLRETIPHGLQKRIFNRMADNLLDLIDKYGQGVIACILDDSLSLEEIMSLLMKNEGKDKGPNKT